MYRYLYGDGMRRQNSVLTPALYDAIDATPGPLRSTTPTYIVNGANDTERPGCKAANWADQAANDDHFSPYWRARNLIPGAKGSKVPLFLTQGLTENNTVADGTAQYLREPHRLRARLARPVGPRPRQRDRRRRQADDGPGRLVRRGDALLRPLPEGRQAEGQRPEDRGADQRRQVARRGGVAARRLDRLHDRAAARGPTPTTGAARSPAPTGSGRSRRRCPTTPTCRDPARRSSTCPRRCRGPTSSSTSTTSSRLERHRPADHPPGPHDLHQRRGPARPLVGRLEDPGRAPDRGPGDRREHRLVGARADLQDVTVHGGADHAPVPAPAARKKTIEGDPGTQLEGYLAETVTVPPETIAELGVRARSRCRRSRPAGSRRTSPPARRSRRSKARSPRRRPAPASGSAG